MRVKNVLLVVGAFLAVLSAKSQWQHYSNVDSVVGTGPGTIVGNVTDVSVYNEDTILAGYYQYIPGSSPDPSGCNVTSDRGVNWTVTFSESVLGPGPKFFSAKKQNTIYMHTSHMGLSDLRKSNDGGNTWMLTYGAGSPYVVYSFVDTGYFYSLPYPPAGFLMRCTAGAQTQIHDFNPRKPVNILFRSIAKGYALTTDSLNSSGGFANTIMSTSDSGYTWTEVFVDTNRYYTHMSFPSDTVLYVTADSGRVIKVNSGANASVQVFAPAHPSEITAIHFVSSELGYLGYNDGTVLVTVNGGATWSNDSSGTIKTIKKFYFINDTTGYFWAGGEIKGKNFTPSTIGIAEQTTKNSLSIRPNPARDNVFLRFSSGAFAADAVVTMYDSFGREVRKIKAQNKVEMTIDIQNLPGGMYYISVVSDHRIYNSSFVKE